MSITEFGRIVRKARIDADLTLGDMARDLGVSAPFLSALETGRKKIPADWLGKIAVYLRERHRQPVPDLETAADVANRSVSLEGLSPQHQALVAGFARLKSLDPEAEKRFMDLIAEVGKDEKPPVVVPGAAKGRDGAQ